MEELCKDSSATHLDADLAPSATSDKGWMKHGSRVLSPSVTGNELTSLSALIAYVAQNSGHSEFRIERQLSDRFNIPNVTCLPATSFSEAIKYLVESITDTP
jgi:hypothetical protein